MFHGSSACAENLQTSVVTKNRILEEALKLADEA
jgi:hypothetical protein